MTVAPLPPTAPRPPTSRRPAYLPALDGLRALAVVLVLLDHADMGVPGGFLGVDVFFVLSGFLITRLLVAELDRTGTVALAAFWIRRARRLLPALALVLAGVAGYAALFAAPEQLASIRADALASAAHVANWRFVSAGEGYFAAYAAPSPLRHVWSLAVEEQWYVLWPLALPFVLRRRRPVAWLLGAAVLSAGVMAWLSVTAGPDRAYYGTDARAQALLIGAAVAVWGARHPVLRARTGGGMLLAGAALLSALVVTARGDAGWMYRGGFTLAALAAAAVVIGCATPGTRAPTVLLDRAPLRALGRVSYGVYLWHWPLFLVLTRDRTGLDGVALLAVRLAATLAFASASYALVEQPARTASWRPARIAAFVPAIAAVTALVVAVATIAPPARIPSASALHALEQPPTTTVPLPESPQAVAKTRPLRVLVMGDSVAGSLARGFQAVSSQYGVDIVDRSEVGCGLADTGRRRRGTRWESAPAHCPNNDAQWYEKAIALDPDVSVVGLGLWDVQQTDVDGRVLAPGTPESDDFILAELDTGVRALRAGGGTVVLLTAPYNAYGSTPGRDGEDWDEDRRDRIDHFNALLRRYAVATAANAGRVVVADLNRFTAPDGEYDNRVAGVRLRDDGVHFTPAGGALVFHWLARQLVPDRTPGPG